MLKAGILPAEHPPEGCLSDMALETSAQPSAALCPLVFPAWVVFIPYFKECYYLILCEMKA